MASSAKATKEESRRCFMCNSEAEPVPSASTHRLAQLRTEILGDNALADYRGRAWGGKIVTIQQALHKSGGEWSCTSLSYEGIDIP